MTSKASTRRHKIIKPLGIIGVIAACVGATVLVIVEVKLYGTGFKGKSLWDWFQLLIIPFVLAVGGYLFNLAVSRNEQAIAFDNQREEALQAYIDKMSELLLEKQLRESDPDAEARKIARVRTLTALPRLDGARKGSVLQFLYESGLIDKDKCIIDLKGADLSSVDLYMIDLHSANLSGANLEEAFLEAASLSGADLEAANLRGANLELADLFGANLRGVDLRGTNLRSASFEDEEWFTMTQLKGATMPDGSKHP